MPTISGREEWLAETLAAYEQTLAGVEYEVVVVKDESSWPRACNVGCLETSADIVLFGADDLSPLEGWWDCARDWLCRHDELPAARVMRDNGIFDNAEDGPDKALVWFTRVPIMRRDQYERIGPWPEITYYADVWVSEKATSIGIRTRILYEYAFQHRWCHIGRVDSPGNLSESRRQLDALRRGMS